MDGRRIAEHMAQRFVIVIGDEGGLQLPVGPRTVVVGRAPGCELVLADDAVSSRHAELWADGDGVWVRDLGSRNGVIVDGAALRGTGQVKPGGSILLGTTTLRVDVTTSAPPERIDALVIEDAATGHGTAFLSDRFVIGEAESANLRVPGVPEVVLLRISEQEVLLGRDDDTQPLALGEPFEIGGRTLIVRPAPPGSRATRELQPEGPRYRIDATLQGGPGPRAIVLDPRTGREFVVASENRATLLWVLAKRWQDEADQAERGWVAEQEVCTAIWGRAAGATPANLRVLVCRVRRDLREGGLDPWFLEHRAGHLRVRVDGARVAD